MNWLDIVLIIILITSLYGGVRQGLIGSVLGFAGFALGLKLAGVYYIQLGEKLTFVPSPATANIIAFVIIWAAVMVVAAILSAILRKAISLVGLGLLDRLGGLFFGAALGVFSCVLIVAVMMHFPLLDFSQTIQDSKIASFLAQRLAFFFSLLPGNWTDTPFLPPIDPGIPA